MSTKAERIAQANEFIRCIASHGRRFFEYVHPDRTEVAHFRMGDDGKLFFWNEWSCIWIYVSRYGPYKGFHHGGTLHSLVSALVEFIKDGQCCFHPSFFNASHWSYDALGISAIIETGQRLGIIKPEEPNHVE
jgi:hypothetical protein